MLSFYLFEILSVIYILGAITASWYFIKKRKTSFLKGIILPIFLFIGILLLLKIQFEPYQLIVRKQTIETGKLQSYIKIALMTDIHFRPLKNGEYLNKVAQKLAQEKPDLIVLAGDFLFYDHINKYEKDFQIFKKMSELAPTFAVLGNHDYGIVDSQDTVSYEDQHEEIKKLLEKSGVKVLVDENTLLNIKNEELQLIGFDEIWQLENKPAQAIKDLDDKKLIIALSHNPDAAYLPESQKIDIVLSGHTHGGQMRLPLIGALAESETVFPRSNYGQFNDKIKPKTFNSVGLGESGFPIRFFNRPEIAILEIK